MSEHLSEEQIVRYRQRSDPPSELIATDDHLTACAACRERLIASKEWSGTTQSLGHDNTLRREHLSYEQYEGYLDGNLSQRDRKLVEAHIALCPACTTDLRDLNSFKLEIDSGQNEEADVRPKDSANDVDTIVWPGLVRSWITQHRATLAVAVFLVAMISLVPFTLMKSPKSTTTGTTSQPTPSPTVSHVLSSEISALPPVEQQRVREVIRSGRILYPPNLAELQGGHETLLGELQESAAVVLGPNAEVVLDVRPLFRWQSVAGARNYSVAIFDSKLNRTSKSSALSGTQWRSTHDLERGQVYRWQITAKMKDGRSIVYPSPPSPEAKFRVLEEGKANEFEHFGQEHPDAHIVLGILYAEAGVLEKAEHEFEQALHAGDGCPESLPNCASYGPELSRRLLASIHEARRGR
jgi:Putative zinc-finger